jgi:multidrug resistance efflux pump
MLSDIAAQEAQVKLDQATSDRYATLVHTNAVAQLTYDQARFTLEVDKNKAKSLRAAGASATRAARRSSRHSRNRPPSVPAG